MKVLGVLLVLTGCVPGGIRAAQRGLASAEAGMVDVRRTHGEAADLIWRMCLGRGDVDRCLAGAGFAPEDVARFERALLRMDVAAREAERALRTMEHTWPVLEADLRRLEAAAGEARAEEAVRP